MNLSAARERIVEARLALEASGTLEGDVQDAYLLLGDAMMFIDAGQGEDAKVRVAEARELLDTDESRSVDNRDELDTAIRLLDELI